MPRTLVRGTKPLKGDIVSDICMDRGDGDCEGTVEPRIHPQTYKLWPRCDKHFESWLDFLEGVERRYGGDLAPSDFDPTYAGETW